MDVNFEADISWMVWMVGWHFQLVSGELDSKVWVWVVVVRCPFSQTLLSVVTRSRRVPMVTRPPVSALQTSDRDPGLASASLSLSLFLCSPTLHVFIRSGILILWCFDFYKYSPYFTLTTWKMIERLPSKSFDWKFII